jgi:hypothetical protein
MSERTRKITVNVPVRVLENAVKVTGKGVTSTVIEGLEELDRRAKRSALRALRDKVRFELDLEDTRRGRLVARLVPARPTPAEAWPDLAARARKVLGRRHVTPPPSQQLAADRGER